MKIRDILIFFIFLTAKIDGRVQIESNWKLNGLNWKFFKFRGYFKMDKSSGGFSKVSPNLIKFNYFELTIYLNVLNCYSQNPRSNSTGQSWWFIDNLFIQFIRQV